MVEYAVVKSSRPTPCIIFGIHGNTMQCNTKTALRLTRFPEPRVRIPNSKGHTEVWESITPTQGAMPKRGSPSPQPKGPHRSVGVHHPNSRGHTTA